MFEPWYWCDHQNGKAPAVAGLFSIYWQWYRCELFPLDAVRVCKLGLVFRVRIYETGTRKTDINFIIQCSFISAFDNWWYIGLLFQWEMCGLMLLPQTCEFTRNYIHSINMKVFPSHLPYSSCFPIHIYIIYIYKISPNFIHFLSPPVSSEPQDVEILTNFKSKQAVRVEVTTLRIIRLFYYEHETG